MSFSQPKLENPCKRFYEWKGDKGIFQYYDKDKEENVPLETPVYFVVLDQLSTIKGYSDQYQCGIYSNEVHSVVKEPLKVKSFKGGFSATGLYSDIKGEIISAGGKFAKSIYCMKIDQQGDHELVNFQLVGAALSSWFEFNKIFNAQTNVFGLMGDFYEDKKGAVKFRVPIFKKFEIKSELIRPAMEMDEQLQNYLKEYKDGAKNQEVEIIEENIAKPESLKGSNKMEDAEALYNTTYGMDAPRRGNEVITPEYVDRDVPPPTDDDIPF